MTSSTVAGIDLMELAGRVEAATAYDGRLMAEVDCAVRFPHLRPAEPNDHPTVKDRRFDASDIWTPTGWLMSRNYFRSLDDARTLVPEGLRLMLSEWDDESHLRAKGAWQAVLSKPGCDASFDAMRGYRCDHAATPALALTAAALRARASLIEEERS